MNSLCFFHRYQVTANEEICDYSSRHEYVERKDSRNLLHFFFSPLIWRLQLCCLLAARKTRMNAYEPSQGQTHLRASVRAIRHKGGDSILMVVVRRRTSCYVLWLSSKVIIFPIIFKSNRVRGSFRYGYFHEKVVSLSLKIYAWHSPIPCFSLHGKHFWENVFEVVQISFDKFLVSLFDFISNAGLPFRNLMVDYNVWQK